jgi:predicted GIY-YIG superfamily endonuclease
MNNMYYVYQLRRADRDQPFYVGKGKGKRAWTHLQMRGDSHKTRTIKRAISESVEVLVEILKDGLSESDALTMEVELINKIGRADLGKGPLTNMTNGGEGTSGFSHSPETRAKMRESAYAQLSDPISRERWMASMRKKDNTKNRLGHTNTPEQNAKIGAANRGRKQPRETCIHCGKSCALRLINRWHNANCKHRIQHE